MSKVDTSLMSSRQHNTRLILEYLLATSAVVNVIINSWQLSNRTIYSSGAIIWGYPILWALLIIPVHFVGALAVYLRAELRPVNASAAPSHAVKNNRPRIVPPLIWKHVREEFRLSASQQLMTMTIRAESNMFLFASWLTATLTIGHLIFGTLVLGSSLFIAPPDATRVVGLYLISTFVCRAILSLEMRGIRKSVVSEEDITLNEQT